MTDKTTVDERDRCHECGECPPSDALRAAMEALRVSEDEYLGYAEYAVDAVLAAWDRQQGAGM